MKKLFYIFLFFSINAFCQITPNWGTKGINAQSTFWLGSLNNQALNIRTNNIQRATILANGNFGIGTANPTLLLHVNGDALINGKRLGIGISNNSANTIFGSNIYNNASSTGIQNNVFGTSALNNNTTGTDICSFGSFNLTANTTGSRLVAFGNSTLTDNTTGTNHTAIGVSALRRLQTGTNVVGIGDAAANLTESSANLTSAFNSVFIGALTRANDNRQANQIVIGFEAVGAGSNSVVLGNDNIAKTVLKGNVGVGTTTPTSKLDINGSFSSTVTVFTTSAILNATHNKIVLNNAATNITITLPDALTCVGRKYEMSRYAGSTGTITVQGTGANQIQGIGGTVGASTTIGAHSAAGAGLRHVFTAVNISGVGVWVRL